jgi:hypothetical protein
MRWQLDPQRKWARLLEEAEQLRAFRAKVEHPLHVIKESVSPQEDAPTRIWQRTLFRLWGATLQRLDSCDYLGAIVLSRWISR